jgi:hypothetical protein
MAAAASGPTSLRRRSYRSCSRSDAAAALSASVRRVAASTSAAVARCQVRVCSFAAWAASQICSRIWSIAASHRATSRRTLSRVS